MSKRFVPVVIVLVTTGVAAAKWLQVGAPAPTAQVRVTEQSNQNNSGDIINNSTPVKAGRRSGFTIRRSVPIRAGMSSRGAEYGQRARVCG